MSFRIEGLDPRPFTHLYGLSDADLAAKGVMRYAVDANPGYPDRITMRDMEVGEQALLLNHEHLPVNSPYRACHAIFIAEGADTAYDQVDIVPDVMKRRLIALRGYDDRGFMQDADIAEGEGIEAEILRQFENPDIRYIHAHNAKRGCFSGLITRTV